MDIVLADYDTLPAVDPTPRLALRLSEMDAQALLSLVQRGGADSSMERALVHRLQELARAFLR